jgi:adenylate kinase
MDIVLFGIQGSGKGTLGKAVAEKYGLTVFETGGELRKLAQEDSELGHKVKNIVEAGHLVPNEVVMDIIANFMTKLPEGSSVLFDGIPRKMVQAESFDTLMKKSGRAFLGILVEVPQDVVMKRLMSRKICKNCKSVYPASYTKKNCEKCKGELITRSDDNPESIKNRIQAYYDETMPVIEHYKKEKKIVTMNGNQSMEDAQKEIFKLLDGNNGK